MGLSKLSSSTVRGTFWSGIAFCTKNHHFQTLSKTLSNFCQNHFGRVVITAIYLISGAFVGKELLSENLCFSIIFQPWEGFLCTSVEQVSARISKLHFSLVKGQLEVGNSIFQKKFPIIEWRNSTFWKKIFGMASKFPFYVTVQSFWEKHTLWKIYKGLTFFGPFGEQVSTPCQKILGHVIKNFFCPFLIFGFWAKSFCILAKFFRQFIQNYNIRVKWINSSKNFGLKNFFFSFSHHQSKTFVEQFWVEFSKLDSYQAKEFFESE